MRNTFGNYIGRVYQIDYDFVISKQKKVQWERPTGLLGTTGELGSCGQCAGRSAEYVVDSISQHWQNNDGGQRQEYEQESVLNEVLSVLFYHKSFH